MGYIFVIGWTPFPIFFTLYTVGLYYNKRAGREMVHTVLIIDGEKANRVQISNILGKEFEIKYASDIKTALNIIADSDIQLVMLDHKYYHLHEILLSQKLTYYFKSLPLILMIKSATGSVRFTRIQ